VGDLIQDAARGGANKIMVGLGGSATNDGGVGMARALGFKFLDASNEELRADVSELLRLAHIEPPVNFQLPSMVAAVDVRNPLLGERGATRIFGPQKGATPEKIELLERALTRLADIVARDLDCEKREVPGAGAAGGLGFGLASFCGASIESGFEVVAKMIDLDAAIGASDIVITGEGKLDQQTWEGKGPAGVARCARAQGKRVYAIVGQTSNESAIRELFDEIFSLTTDDVPPEEAMKRPEELLRQRASELARQLGSHYQL
jgi:glycerate kinase